MKNTRQTLFSAIVVLVLAGCDSSGDDPVVVTPPPPPPPPPAPTEFTTFVKDQFANTSDMTDPVDVDDVDLAFSDDDDPAAFDDLLQ